MKVFVGSHTVSNSCAQLIHSCHTTKSTTTTAQNSEEKKILIISSILEMINGYDTMLPHANINNCNVYEDLNALKYI